MGRCVGSGWTNPRPPIRAVFSGEIMLSAERLLHGSQFSSTVLRLGGIYGPGRTRLIDRVRGGEPVAVADAPAYTNRIHRDDAAKAIAHLLALPNPARPTWASTRIPRTPGRCGAGSPSVWALLWWRPRVRSRFPWAVPWAVVVAEVRRSWRRAFASTTRPFARATRRSWKRATRRRFEFSRRVPVLRGGGRNVRGPGEAGLVSRWGFL